MIVNGKIKLRQTVIRKERTSRPFEEWEKDFLRLTYLDFKTIEIANILGRGSQAIANHLRPYSNYNKILNGDKFGRLVIIDILENNKYKCLCQCGKECIRSIAGLHTTQSCGCLRLERISTGFGAISGVYLSKIKDNAKDRGLDFNLTTKYLDNLWQKQGGKCILSGLDISGPVVHSKKCMASLDRINSEIGYIEGNVQWVHKHINYMKWSHRQEYFINLCQIVTKYQNESNSV